MGRVMRICSLMVFFTLLAGWNVALSSEAKAQSDPEMRVKEMPVLTGDVWGRMTPDEKVSFVWGIGHVVTIERQMTERYPELRREGFTAKLAEGLAGLPMNEIIAGIDGYYRDNPDDLAAPVMEVIWDEMVRPRIKTGIAGLPLDQE